MTVGQSKNDDGSWPYADTAQAIEKMGAKHVDTSVDISYDCHYNLTLMKLCVLILTTLQL